MKLEAKDISFRYDTGSRQILNRVSISVESGERVGIAAPSGFGKTTFCKILAGYEKPDSGKVLLDGTEFANFRGRLPVQMIWQHPEQSVNPRWKMAHALKEGGRISSELLDKLGIRQEWLDRFPSELSGGELQRFCIARALGEGTKILLADEITTMLDMVTQSAIWHALIEETEKRGIGMLVVSHSDSLTDRVCTRKMNLV
ncbi:ABC transporter ATP-binding protein [uncultured Clostridium sp.]|uniref:ABC transporter ATP-binding protein n=1 Tax=uncultured Clostridium sp. TaxID=59620 RepID=UPI0025F8A2D5|nr:ATP-binding cassette domain-containing protein [uncultured Clostridium sp.]